VSSKGKGNTDETLRQSQMVAEGSIAIKAVEGLKIDVAQVNQQTVSQSIDAMVKADPQLAWLKDAQARGDVDWRQVKEIHDSFKYSNSGLGPASQLVIAIVMAAVVGPMAMGAVGASTGAAVTAGTMSAGTATFLSASAGAIAAGAATNATVSVINNRGNLGAVVKDVTSSDAMKGYVISGVTAGLTAAYFDGFTGTHTDIASGKIIGPELSTWTGVGQFAGNQVLQNGTSAILGKALGSGGNGSDALKTALFNTLAAASFNAVGDYTHGTFADGAPPKVIIHAMVGGLLSKATGGDFRTGALAAGANEALVVHLNSLVNSNENLLTMSSQIVGALAAASQKDANASSIEKGSWIAKNSTQYNFLSDHATRERTSAREAYEKDQGIDAARKLVALEKSDQRSNNLLDAYKTNPESLTKADLSELQAYLQVYAYELTRDIGQEQAEARLTNLLQSTKPATQGFSYAGTTNAKNAHSDAARAELGGIFEQLTWSRTKTAEE
jgi:filamentous hemagglutinin